MAIDSRQTQYIANLARLNIEEKNINDLTQQLNTILSLVEQMNVIDTNDIDPMTHPQDPVSRLRVDSSIAPSDPTHLCVLAPKTKDNHYLVPKVID